MQFTTLHMYAVQSKKVEVHVFGGGGGGGEERFVLSEERSVGYLPITGVLDKDLSVQPPTCMAFPCSLVVLFCAMGVWPGNTRSVTNIYPWLGRPCVRV